MVLQLKDVTKVYRPKKGVPVIALHDVSIQFPERGMIFILGKSGSGKSTLLNLLGGLDRYDKGEILFYGKSTLKFSERDYDCYRNSFVGFVFQEFNLLDEFSVGENIGLVMELQGKRITKEAIDAILCQVGLEGYWHRKPNELSGGQKQRVAIARALVKEPKLILADEPTGNLDQETGRQLFDVLKKLSQDKLIIVVSHDRELAETYGDRIIELEDGKIITDVKRSVFETKRPIKVVDYHTIQVKDGYR